MNSEIERELEEAREHYHWAAFFRVLWISLIPLGAAGVLAVLSVLLGWGPYLLLSVLGALAGFSVLAAMMGSTHTRGLTGLVLGAITLPLLASSLASDSVRDQVLFDARSGRMLPFVAHGIGAFVSGFCVVVLWRRRPRPPQATRPADGEPLSREGAVP